MADHAIRILKGKTFLQESASAKRGREVLSHAESWDKARAPALLNLSAYIAGQSENPNAATLIALYKRIHLAPYAKALAIHNRNTQLVWEAPDEETLFVPPMPLQCPRRRPATSPW